MEIGTIISIGAVIISALALVLNSRKETRVDAAEQAAIGVKLDTISNGISDIRVDLRTMRNNIADLDTRLTRVEERSKSNTKRIDMMDKKGE